MVAQQTSILFKTPEGDFHLTEQGEFLAYFDAHIHLFEVFLHKKKLSKEEETFALEGIKTYMSKSVTKVDHFFEKMEDFSDYLKTDSKTLTDFLTSQFMDVLAESQKKITNIELDRLEGPDSFRSITEEILFKVGSILPKSSQFSIVDDLLVIQNKATGQITKPVGMLVEVKEVQEKAQKEKEEAERIQKEKLALNEKKQKIETISQTTTKDSVPTVTPVVFEPELSILKEILESIPLKLNGNKLEVSNEFDSDEAAKSETSQAKEIITEIPDIPDEIEENQSADFFLEDSQPSESSNQNEIDFEIESDSRYGITSGNEEDFEFETPTITDEDFSQDPISQVESSHDSLELTSQIIDDEIVPDIDIEEDESPQIVVENNQKLQENNQQKQKSTENQTTKINPNAFISFNYIDYLQITRSIEKLKSDKNEYNEWISKASVLIKTFISIQANISKESRGDVLDWDNYYHNVSSKAGLEVSVLENFKARIEILNLTKKFLDISVTELKKQPEKVQKILKSGWPHIVDTFGDSPDFDKVSENLGIILAKIKEESIRQPIEKILNLAIKNLRQRLN